MRQIWDGDYRKFWFWLMVEQAVLAAREQLGQITAGITDHVKSATWIDRPVVAAIVRRDKVINHDLNAFVEIMRLQIIMGRSSLEKLIAIEDDDEFHRRVEAQLAFCQGNISASAFHDGMTSYDTEEPAWAMLLLESAEVILADLNQLIGNLKARALRHRGQVIMGRTHGQAAQPMTFGIKCVNWLESARRVRDNLDQVMEENRVMKLSGAVGVYGTLPPEVEKLVGEILGLQPVRSSQIVPLEIRARLMNELALTAAVMEKIADDLWHACQTERGEVREAFGKSQKGSSAMPHKKNPILDENVQGCAILVQGYAATMLRLVNTHDERDIRHSAAERIIWPDAFGMLDHLIQRLAGFIEKMEVFTERMKEHLEASNGVFASQKLEMLLKQKGVGAEDAYRLVQEASFKTRESKRHLRLVIMEYPAVAAVLTIADLNEIFDWESWVKEEDYIYQEADLTA